MESVVVAFAFDLVCQTRITDPDVGLFVVVHESASAEPATTVEGAVSEQVGADEEVDETVIVCAHVVVPPAPVAVSV